MISENEISKLCNFTGNSDCKFYASIETSNAFETQILLLLEKFQNYSDINLIKFPAIGLIEGMILVLKL